MFPAPVINTNGDAQRNFEWLTVNGTPVRVLGHVPTDADFLPPVTDGVMAVNSATNRLYIRVLGTWKYTALT